MIEADIRRIKSDIIRTDRWKQTSEEWEDGRRHKKDRGMEADIRMMEAEIRRMELDVRSTERWKQT